MKNKLIELLQKWFGQVVRVEAGDNVTFIFTHPENIDADEMLHTWEMLQNRLPGDVVLIPEGVVFHKAILEKK